MRRAVAVALVAFAAAAQAAVAHAVHPAQDAARAHVVTGEQLPVRQERHRAAHRHQRGAQGQEVQRLVHPAHAEGRFARIARERRLRAA
ncbi:MAG: hypothetical protein ACKORL_00400, partial [Phycisphaerales bacterium]